MKLSLALLLVCSTLGFAAVGPSGGGGTVIPGGSTNVALLNGTNSLSGTNTFTKPLSVVTPNNGNVQLSLLQGANGYTLGRNAGTGNLDILGNEGYSLNFNGGAIFAGGITSGGNSVLANNASSVVFNDLRISGGDLRLGNTSGGTGYIIARDSATGFLHFNAQQGTYTGYYFHAGNASNALVVTQSGSIGMGTATPASKLQVVGNTTSDGYRTTQQTLGYTTGTNLTVNATNSLHFVSLTNTAYFTAPTSLGVGASFTIHLQQDATGTRVVTFDTNYWKFPGGVVPTITTNANAFDVLSCISCPYGTNVFAIVNQNFR